MRQYPVFPVRPGPQPQLDLGTRGIPFESDTGEGARRIRLLGRRGQRAFNGGAFVRADILQHHRMQDDAVTAVAKSVRRSSAVARNAARVPPHGSPPLPRNSMSRSTGLVIPFRVRRPWTVQRSGPVAVSPSPS